MTPLELTQVARRLRDDLQQLEKMEEIPVKAMLMRRFIEDAETLNQGLSEVAKDIYGSPRVEVVRKGEPSIDDIPF